TGQLPFSAENQIALVSMHMHKPPPSPRSISQNISPQVERVIYKALAKQPEQRYGSATELADAFCLAVAARNQGEMQEYIGSSVQRPPEVIVPHANSNKIVLPPLPPLAPNVRPAPLSSTAETAAPYVPPRPASPPVTNLPYESRRPPVTPPSTRSRAVRSRTWIVAILALLTLLLII